MSVAQPAIQILLIMQYLHVLQHPVIEMRIIRVVVVQVVILAIQMAEVEVYF